LALILASTSFITLFRGGAGTGKSFVLQRLQRALDREAAASVILAPQRQQVLDLTRDGLHGAQTVSECLQRGELPRGAVVVVDEAGQIGGRQFLELVRLVQQNAGRLILSGDTRQHGPVETSDALRAIERYSGLHAAELTEIRRQDPARGEDEAQREYIVRYREAVRAAADGDAYGSFERLDELGCVRECGVEEQCECLSEAYVALALTGGSAIVVSQTRAEVRTLNDSIRQRLRASGLLTGGEVEITALEQLDLTAAQKRDQRFYAPDSVLVFNRNFRGCTRGDQGRLVGFTGSGIVLEVSGKVRRIPFTALGSITVCRPTQMPLCAGDRLQIKCNGLATDGRKLANGEIVTVDRVDASGVVRLQDGRDLPASFRQFLRGYAVTSYGSQGKTVDHVLFGDAAVRAASNSQQWYVSISRGRKSVQIFTPDKEQLSEAIKRAGDRELALDLVRTGERKAVREPVLRGLRRGRELTRRLCRLAMRAWTASFLKHQTVNTYETKTRNEQTGRADHPNVLAT